MKEREFISFATQFCKTYDVLPVGEYSDEHGKFIIRIVESGTNLVRVGHKSGTIEILNKSFDNLKTSTRMFFLLWCYHKFNMGDSDASADKEALNSLMGLNIKGFSKRVLFKEYSSVLDRYEYNKDRIKIFLNGLTVSS